MRLAIFDFDETILNGNSWHEFFLHELRRQKSRAPFLLTGLVLRKLRLWTGPRLRELALRGMRGLTAEQVAQVANNLHKNALSGLLRPEARTELNKCHEQGLTIVIATGTFEFIVQPFAREHKVEHVVASQIAFKDGICTGRRAGPEMLGQQKANALKDRFKDLSIDWEQSSVYTDSTLDLPLLKLASIRHFIAVDETIPSGLPENTTILHWHTPPH